MAKDFTYKMNIDADVGALTGKLKTLKDALTSVISDGKEPKIAKILDQLGTRIDNIKTKAATPVKSEAAFTGMEKEIQGVQRLLEALGTEITNVGKKTNAEKISLLPESEQKRLLAVVDAMKKYDSAIDTSTKKSKELVDAEKKQLSEEGKLTAKTKELEERRKSLATAESKANAAKIAKEAAEKRKEEADAAEEQYQKIKKLAEARKKDDPSIDLRKAKFDDGQGGETTLAAARGKAQSTAHAAEKDDLDALTQTYRNARDEAQNFQDSVNRLAVSVKNQESAAKIAADKVKELTTAFDANRLKASNDAFNELTRQAKDLGINLEGIGADNTPENVALLKQRMEEFVAQGVEPANAQLQQATTITEQYKTAADHTSESNRHETKTFKEQNEAAGQVDGIINRIKQFTGLTGVALVMRRALRSAINTTKELDEQMTKMAVVTDLKVGDYWKQLPEHTEQANQLGVAIKDVYEAETLYYQQGLKTAQVQKISVSTLKMARIAGLGAEDATNKMTAALRGFNMEINETNADRIADVYSKLAAITASSVSEISSAMTKTASIASNAGMQFETTAAFLSQIIETTRESAETAGTALKTVIARFQELKKSPEEIGEIDGEIVDANKIETALRSVGVALRDTKGQFRELDDVFIELSSKWDSLDMNTQRYIATIAAGSRQQSRFVAMMSNYARTQELVSAANNAAGASNEQFNKTLESLESKLAQLKNAWDTFTQGLANNQFIKIGVDILTGFLSILNKITAGFGPWSGSALKIGLVTTALILGDKALKIFMADLHQNHSILKAGGQVFNKAGISIGNFTKKLFANIKALKANRQTNLQDIAAVKARQQAQAKASAIEAEVKRQEKELSEIRVNESKSTEAVRVKEEQLRRAKEHSVIANETLAKTQQEEGIALGLTAAQQEIYNTMVSAGVVEEDAAILAKAGLTTASWANMQAAYGEAAASHAAELADKLRNKGLIIQTLIKWDDQIATIAQAAATGTYTGSAIAATAAQWALTIAEWAACPPLAALAILIAIVIAAIALLVLAIYGLVKMFQAIAANSPEGKLKSAEESLKSAADAADAASESFKGLKDSFASLTEKYGTLDELVVGTREWRDAMLEVNNQVMDLIDKYPELSKSITIDANGVMRLSEEAMRQAEDAAARTQAEAQTAKLVATMKRNQAQDEVRFSQLSNAAVAGNEAAAIKQGIFQGFVAGNLGVIGAMIAAEEGDKQYGLRSGQSWGSALATNFGGGIGGAIVGGIMGSDISRSINEEVTNAIAKQLATEGFDETKLTTTMQRFGLSTAEIDDWINELSKDSSKAAEELRKYGQALEQTNSANRAIMQTMIQNSISMIDTTKYSAEQLKQMSNIGTELANTVLKAKEAKMASVDKHELDKDQDYLDYWEGIYGKGNVEISNYGKVKVKNDEGEFEVNADDARSQFASAQGAKELTEKMEAQAKALLNAGKNIAGFNQALNKAFNDDQGMGLARENLAALNVANLQEAWNDSEDLKEMYDGDFEAFKKAMAERIKLAQEAFNENSAKLATFGLKGFTFDHSLTAEAEKGLVTHMNQVVAVSGSEVGEQLGNQINGLLSSVAIEDRDKLTSQLNAIDWHDADDLENLPETLKAIGLNLPEEDLDDFIASAKEAAHAIHNIDMVKLNESLTELTQALDEIRTNRQGRTFEGSLYEKIIATDATLKNSFVKNLDGSYTYLGTSMDKLVNAINENTEVLIQEKQDILNNRLGARGILDEMTKTKNSELDITKIGAATETMQRKWLKEFLIRANDEGLNLDGISANLSSDTDVKLLSKEAVKEIINDLRGIGTAESIAQEINDTIVEALATTKLDQDAYYQTHTATAEKAEKGQLTKEDIPDYQTSRRALISQAQQTGISEQDLQRLIRYNETLSQMESQQEQNTKEYRRTSKAVNELMNKLAQKTSFQTMYEGLKENVEKSNELVESYKNTTSEMEKQFIVSQMMAEFGIQVTEDNYQHLAYLTHSYLQGSESGFIEIVNLAGYAAGIMGNAYEAIGEKTEQEIRDMGAEYLRFAQQMENAGYGWFDSVTRQFHFSIKELLNIAKDTAEEIEQWLSPYDWLWNSERRINAELRKRNELEREYQYIQERGKTSLQETTSNLAQQVELTRQMAEHQKDIVQNAIKELSDYVSDKNPASQYLKDKIAVGPNGQIVVDKEALYSMKYNADEGSIIEEVVDKVESLVDTALSAQDTLADLEEDMYNYTQAGKEQYASLLDRTTEALRSQYQKEIDKLSNIHDAINDAQSKLIDKIQEKIDDDRNARERADKEKSLSDKATQIAYLQASGGSQLDILKLQKEYDQEQQSYTDSLIDNGIKELQDANQKAADQRQEQIDIAQAQFDYWDTNKSVQEAEQMLESALIKIAGGETAVNTVWGKLLKGEDNVKAQSRDAMIEWDKELNNSTNLALIYSGINDKGGIKDQVLSINNDIKNLKDALTVGENSITTYAKLVKDQVDKLKFGNTNRLLTDPTQFTYTKTEMDAKFSALGKKIDDIKNVTDDNTNNGEKGSNKTTSRFSTYDMMLFDPDHYNQSKIEDKALMNELDQNTAFQKHSAVYDPINPNTMYQKGFNGEYYKYTLKLSGPKKEPEKSSNLPSDPNDYGSMNKAIAASNLRYVKLETENMEYYYKPKLNESPRVQSYGSDGEAMLPGGWSEFFEGNWIVRSVTQDDKGELYYWLTNPWNTLLGAFKETDLKKIGFTPSFLTGGLADFTGPAWLDGTQSAPELVLNATDTANFIALKDILSDIMRGAHERASDKQNSEGNNYYDIEVNVESVDSDYDVDQAVERMKELIEADAMYRNVNAVQKS